MCKACHSCIRILMMIFNFIFVLCGLGLFGIGLYLYLWSFFKNTGPEGTYVVIAFYVTMGVGAFTLIVGACGCCGAYHESPCLLGTYFVFLLVIFAAEIAAGVLALIYREQIQDFIGKMFETGKNRLAEDPKNKDFWMNQAQKTFSCCGFKGPSDYSPTLPSSCCPNGGSCTLASPDHFKKGCEESWKDFMKDKIFIFAGVPLGIAFIELLGLIFSMCLCCTARSIDYDMVETRA